MKTIRLFKSAKSFGLAIAATSLLTSLFIVSPAHAYKVLDTNGNRITTWSVVCPSGYSLYNRPYTGSIQRASLKKYTAIRIKFSVRYEGPTGGSVIVGVYSDAADSIFRTPITSEKFTMSNGQVRRFDVQIPRSEVRTAFLNMLGVQATIHNHPHYPYHRGYISLPHDDFDCKPNSPFRVLR